MMMMMTVADTVFILLLCCTHCGIHVRLIHFNRMCKIGTKFVCHKGAELSGDPTRGSALRPLDVVAIPACFILCF